MSKAPTPRPVEPLLTRHVFLDTEVYRRAGFNLSNTQFTALKKYVAEGHLVLHFTDITLAEIQRQLKESVREISIEAKRLTRALNRLGQIGGAGIPKIPTLDQNEIENLAWRGFVDQLVSELKGHSVAALQVPARRVFEEYFAGRAPFDVRNSKEFPDAFVILGLSDYCASNDLTMYVVSADAAMGRAADATAGLLPLKSIDDLLAAAAAAAGDELEPLVDAIFSSPGFDDQVIDAITTDLDFITFIYYGTLRDASVHDPELEEILNIDDYRIVSFDENSLGLIMNAICVLRVRIDYVDEEEIRDRDEDALQTDLRTYSSVRCALKIFVSVNLATQKFNETELLTREVIVE